jgi:hypothetical protein
VVKAFETSAAAVSPAVSVQALAQVGRKVRRPTHTFQLRTRPWQIQPFLVAPVLPGETMKNLLLQARVVTDPIKNPLIGWWTEFYFFYVKLRDLDDRQAFTDMLVTNTSTAALNTAANVATYHPGGTVDFATKCLNRVVDQYFRDEDEAVLAASIDGLPLAQAGVTSFLDSAILDSAVKDTGETVPGTTTTLDPNLATQFGDAYAHWEAMRSMQLTAADFEDWLKTFGVKVPKAEQDDPHTPELIRYVREWQYPSNTINPSNGVPSSAVSWSVAARADKDRFFSEPGFVFGVNVTRPKVYMSKQKGAGVGMMNDAYSWLPAVLQTEPYTSLKKFLGTEGPLQGNTGGAAYWVDLRDLFVHGDQFCNFALTATDAGLVALPTATMGLKYPTAADADSLFSDVTTPNNKIKMDGRTDLSILSRIEDTSL